MGFSALPMKPAESPMIILTKNYGEEYNPVFDSLQDRETLYSPYFIGCTAYFPLVLLFGNLLPSLTLFLDFFHFLFRDKLIVRPKAAYLMQRICDPFPLI